MPRCYVPAAAAGGAHVSLSDAEAHHVTHVLRLRPGDAVIAFDGRGHEWDARIAVVSRAEVAIALVSARTPVPEPVVAVTLVIGLLKGDQMDDVVRDATALGVSRIAPVVTQHVSVPARAWSREGLDDRWRRIAIAAAKQCGRAVVPDVDPVRRFDVALREAGPVARIVCVEPARAGAGHDLGPAPASALLCVGPEGGWSEEELALVTDGDARRLALGPRTLRAELTPAVALASVWSSWGW